MTFRRGSLNDFRTSSNTRRPNIKETRVSIRVQPGTGRNEVLGFAEDVLRLRVTAPAREGKANEAIVSLLAEVLDIPKSRIRLVRGQRSRDKVLVIEGLGLEEVKRILSAD